MAFEAHQNCFSNNRVCIVIVNYNHQIYLKACLNTLNRFISKLDTVIIIDNNSGDRESLNDLVTKHPECQWIFNRENLGFTGANHQGSQWALKNEYQYLFILNPDTELFADTIPLLVSASKKCNDQWILGPLLIQSGTHKDFIIDSAGLDIDRYYRAKDKYQGRRLSQIQEKENIIPVNGLCGAAMFIPTNLFPLRSESDSTVFCETYFAYFEDMEFSLHWRRKGGYFGMIPDALISHQRGDQSQLRKITYKKWKANPFIIEKMFINRYLTIIRYETITSLIKNHPTFLFYEIVRAIYILLRQPYLLALVFKGWGMLVNHLILNKK